MKKELTFAVMVLFMTLLCHEAYAQANAEANATNVQSQGSVGSQKTMAVGLAHQNQNQSQGQSASGGSVSGSGNATFKNSFNGAAPIRYLPVPTAVPMENYQPGMFGRADYADKGPDFISMRQIVAAMNMADLTVEVEGEKRIRIITQMLTVPKPQPTPKTPKDKSKITKPKPQVKFEINDGEAVNHGFVPVAVLSVETEKPDKSNSASLALAIGKKAAALGAKRVVFLTEGSSKELNSSGWGIGLSYNYATVGSKASDSGSVGSGGTGYSQGKAAYSNLVYLTAIVGN